MTYSKIPPFFLRKPKFQFIFSGSFVVLALVVAWLVSSEGSPLYNYFLWHGGARDLWWAMNITPFIVSAIISRNPDAPSEVIFYIGFIAQWFSIGFLLSVLISMFLEICLRGRHSLTK